MQSWLGVGFRPLVLLGMLALAVGCGGEAGDSASGRGADRPADLEETSDALLAPPPDATGQGPLATTFGDYHLPAAIDTDVLSDRQTEIWARV